jgi:hypothetical protein
VPRKAAAGRAGGKAAALAAQVERINNGLDAVAGLLSEVQGLRTRFDAFAQRVEARLATRIAKPRERVNPPQTGEVHPVPVEEPHSTPFTAGEDAEPAETNDILQGPST